MVNKFAVALIALVLAIIAILMWVAFHYYGTSVKADGKLTQLQSDNDLQTLTIATQSLNFQRSNQIASSADQYAVKITGDSQEREIEYRTILKAAPTCALPIPTDIANGLYDYANRLRASAMYADTSNANDTSVSAAASRSITYCQAVLWINPLLMAIDKANSQLSSIREFERDRK